MAQLKNIQLPTLSNSETDGLKIFFARLYSVSLVDVNVNSVTYKFKEITFNGKIIGRIIKFVCSHGLVVSELALCR